MVPRNSTMKLSSGARTAGRVAKTDSLTAWSSRIADCTSTTEIHQWPSLFIYRHGEQNSGGKFWLHTTN